jgi:prephenate dehydrogenase/chorismate mutase
MRTLDEVRIDLDRIDQDLIRLLDERLKLTEEVADWKNSQPAVPYTDPVRERAILEHVRTKVQSPILKDGVSDVYIKLFQMSKYVRHLREVPTCPFVSCMIIGDGLIGRSIAQIIETKNAWYPKNQVACVIKNHDWSIEDIYDADLIIIATPIDTVRKIAGEIAQSASQRSRSGIVIDVSSVKGSIASVFATLNGDSRLTFVPTHPMGGSQGQGAASAQTSLFAGRPWVICPAGIDVGIIDHVTQFVRYCGSLPHQMDAQTHDCLAAYISHMPGVVSKALVDFVTSEKPEALSIAGSGFELMTKIGKTANTRMRSLISQTNKENIDTVIDAFSQFLRTRHLWK